MNPNFNRAAETAYRTLMKLHIDRLPISPLKILRQCNNTVVHTYDEIMPRFGISDRYYFRQYQMDDNDAVTIRRDIGGQIVYELYYDSHINQHRMRFTLAHELGHILLHHKMEEPWEEKEADYFAAQLLAPRPVFSVLAVHGFDISSTELIAITFCLSQAAATIAAKTPIYHTDNQLYRAVENQFAEFAEYATGASA